MSKPVICGSNLLRPVSRLAKIITTSGYKSQFPPDNAFSGIETEGWVHDLPGQAVLTLDTLSQQSCDYWAIRGHFDSAVLQTSSDNITFTDVSLPVVGNGTVKLVLFNEFVGRYYRFVINRFSTEPEVELLSLGPRIEVPVGMRPGFQPHALASVNNASTTETNTDQFLGTTSRPGKPTSQINLDYLPETWVRQTWVPFIKQQRNQAFVYSWDHENSPEDAIYCWITDRNIPTTYRQNRNFMRVRINVKGAASAN